MTTIPARGLAGALALTFLLTAPLLADEAAAVRAITQAGGQVHAARGELYKPGRPVASVSFSVLKEGVKGITDEQLKRLMPHIASFKQLNALDLVGTRITNDGLKHLAALKNQRGLRLNVSYTKVGDPGMKHLNALPYLRELNISNTTSLTDAGLQQLAKNKNLRVLYLGSKTKVTQRGVNALKKALPNCEVNVRFVTK